MTGAEQTTVNELANLTRGFTAELSDFRSEMRHEITQLRGDIRVLQDDKVARDAVADKGNRDYGRLVTFLGIATAVAVFVGNVIVRVVMGS